MNPPNPFDDLLVAETGELIHTAEAWESKRQKICGRFREMLGKPPTTDKPPPDVTVCSETRCGPFVRREIEFSVHEDERAHAYIHIPTGLSGQAPAVLCLQQTAPHDREAVMGVAASRAGEAYGKDLAERGFVTFCADHFNAGKRIPPEGPFDTAAFYRRFPEWSAVGKSVWESRIALDILGDLDEVDAARLGCMGHSLGGHGSTFLALCDPRSSMRGSQLRQLDVSLQPRTPVVVTRTVVHLLPDAAAVVYRGEAAPD